MTAAPQSSAERVVDHRPSSAQTSPSSHQQEALRRFAGGIAHDFSNFLASMTGFAQLLLMQHRANPELAGDLEEIVKAVSRATKMTDQLAVLSGHRPLSQRPLDLNHELTRLAATLRPLLGERIQLALQLADCPLMVSLDPAREEEFLITLCEFARSEMLEGGTLRIATAPHHISTSDVTLADLSAGDYAHLSVHCQGASLEADVAEQMFEPYVLKSRLKRGTGLGLPVVRALVRQHGGEIRVEHVRESVTFHLYLPRLRTS